MSCSRTDIRKWLEKGPVELQYINEEFRPKHCSFALYRSQMYDLYVKRNDLKARYVPFNVF